MPGKTAMARGLHQTSVAPRDLVLHRNAELLRDGRVQRVEVRARDRTGYKREPLAHRDGRETLVGYVGRRFVVVADVDADHDVGAELLRQHAAAEAADLLMAGDGAKETHVPEVVIREQACDLRDDETSQARRIGSLSRRRPERDPGRPLRKTSEREQVWNVHNRYPVRVLLGKPGTEKG